MKKFDGFINVLSFCLTIFLWVLQMLPQEHENQAVDLLCKHSMCCGLVAAASVLLVQAWNLFWYRKRLRKKWIRNLFQQIITDHLGGDNYKTRISMFRTEVGYVFLFKYLWYFLILNFMDNFKNKMWWKRAKHIPIHLFSKYLTVYVRYSYPKQQRSYTYFRVTAAQDKYNGIVEKCFREGEACETNTVFIDANMNIPATCKELTSSSKSKVTKYLKDSFIDEAYYESFYFMNRKANHLYAIPIMREDQTQWGVIVIDNNGKDKFPIREKVEIYMKQYIRIFNYTI